MVGACEAALHKERPHLAFPQRLPAFLPFRPNAVLGELSLPCVQPVDWKHERHYLRLDAENWSLNIAVGATGTSFLSEECVASLVLWGRAVIHSIER